MTHHIPRISVVRQQPEASRNSLLDAVCKASTLVISIHRKYIRIHPLAKQSIPKSPRQHTTHDNTQHTTTYDTNLYTIPANPQSTTTQYTPPHKPYDDKEQTITLLLHTSSHPPHPHSTPTAVSYLKTNKTHNNKVTTNTTRYSI